MSALQLTERPGTLSLAQCDEIIERFGPFVSRSQISTAAVYGLPLVSSTRTSSSVKVGSLVPAGLRALVAELTGLPESHQESWEVIRYQLGEQFKAHHDWFVRPAGEGGQRLYSVLVYLRAPACGGSTVFPLAKRRVAAEAGKLVLWRNTVDHLHALPSARHAALPVREGEKWSLVTWVCGHPVPRRSTGYISA